jgi:hypothetical protein
MARRADCDGYDGGMSAWLRPPNEVDAKLAISVSWERAVDGARVSGGGIQAGAGGKEEDGVGPGVVMLSWVLVC